MDGSEPTGSRHSAHKAHSPTQANDLMDSTAGDNAKVVMPSVKKVSNDNYNSTTHMTAKALSGHWFSQAIFRDSFGDQ